MLAEGIVTASGNGGSLKAQKEPVIDKNDMLADCRDNLILEMRTSLACLLF
jgi:hypothetical protein